MQFKHPEILYFLFLLVIPILVHLFQLRRFKKEYFTKVKLLKELQIQTRKSATIKKWLLLVTRLLLLTALIFAFAQPFFKAKDFNKKSKNSRMGKGKGSLLRLSCKVKKNMIFMEFLNLNYIILNKIVCFFKIKNNLNVKVIKKDNFNIVFKRRNICYYNVYKQF